LRGGSSHNHHKLFSSNPSGKREKLGFHHVAFEVLSAKR
jgi:hypothetical protein